jgi:hypothetical protein
MHIFYFSHFSIIAYICINKIIIIIIIIDKLQISLFLFCLRVFGLFSLLVLIL